MSREPLTGSSSSEMLRSQWFIQPATLSLQTRLPIPFHHSLPSSLHTPVLTHSCCYNKIPQVTHLVNIRNSCSHSSGGQGARDQGVYRRGVYKGLSLQVQDGAPLRDHSRQRGQKIKSDKGMHLSLPRVLL